LRIARLVDAARERFLDDARLDEHLLEHEMLEAVFFGGGRVPHHLGDLALDRVPDEIGQLVAILVDDDHLAFAQDHLLTRVLQDRGRIRRDKHLVVADAHHKRARAAARKHEPIRGL